MANFPKDACKNNKSEPRNENTRPMIKHRMNPLMRVDQFSVVYSSI